MSGDRPIPESRLDELREDAARAAAGAAAPAAAPAVAGYHGRPVLKPPVWTWEVPAYLFVGGLAGMAAVLGFAAVVVRGDLALARDALRLAVAGALVSPVLLVLDLGRPARFLAMLRVVKLRSPMSVGVWTLALFSPAAIATGAAVELGWTGFAAVAGVAAALLGLLLATYTGVLLAATAIPAWNVHGIVLPVHFGLAGLGSAVAALELLGHATAPLMALGIAVSVAETFVGISVEVHPRGPHDRAHRHGLPGLLMRTAGALAGPGSLALRLAGLRAAAAIAFLAAALLSRYGWVAAGRACARDPEAVLASGGPSPRNPASAGQ